MELFKNKVGRPSNSTIMKRRIFYAGCGIFAIALLIGASFMVVNNKRNLTTKISASDGKILFYSTNSNLIYNAAILPKAKATENNKKHDVHTYAGNSSENGTKLIVEAGKTAKINVEGTFKNSKYYPSSGKKKLKIKYVNLGFVKIPVISFGTTETYYELCVNTRKYNDFFVDTGNCKKITSSSTVSLSPVTISSDVGQIRVILTKVTDGNRSTVEDNKIYITSYPKMTATKDKNASSPNSNGASKVSKSGTYSTSFKMTSAPGFKYYYKTFLYSSNDLNYKNIFKESSCYSFTESKNYTDSYNINPGSSLYTVRTRLYTSKDTCDNDTSKKSGTYGKKDLLQNTSTQQKFLLDSSISYYLVFLSNVTFKNSSTYKVLNFDLEALGTKIGTQAYQLCPYYAEAYGHYILTSGHTDLYTKSTSVPTIGYTRNVDSWVARGHTYFTNVGKQTESNPLQMYNIVVKYINKGVPVIVQFSAVRKVVSNHYEYAKDHYVLAVGYKTGVSNMSNDTKAAYDDLVDALYIVDPYNNIVNRSTTSDPYEQIGKNVLYAGPGTNAPGLSNKEYYGEHFITWALNSTETSKLYDTALANAKACSGYKK